MTRFAVRLDADDTLIELDNRNIDPTKVWEIDPVFLPEYQNSIVPDVPSNEKSAFDVEYRGETEARFTDLSGELSRIEKDNRDFQATTASMLRHIAADLLNISEGQKLEFSKHYADKYDHAMRGANNVSSSLRESSDDSYTRRHDREDDDGVRPLEKCPSITECSKLTD
jgi:hypothetical protein